MHMGRIDMARKVAVGTWLLFSVHAYAFCFLVCDAAKILSSTARYG